MSQLLVADDDSLMRGFVADALRAAHEVVEAETTVRALDLLASSQGGFDVVVVACLVRDRRPLFTGVELIRTIFERWPWIPIVAIAGLQELERLRAELLLSGVHEVLRWPVAGSDLAKVVSRVARGRVRRPRTAPATVAKIQQALAFLGDEPLEMPTLGGLAARAAMSRSAFSRAFNATVGMSLRGYLRELRLRRAHDLLVESDLSLTAIAAEAGFYDLAHLDKAFRERVGIAPEQFRRRYRRMSARRAHPRAGPRVRR
jgi:AraC-like DNA-binding protein